MLESGNRNAVSPGLSHQKLNDKLLKYKTKEEAAAGWRPCPSPTWGVSLLWFPSREPQPFLFIWLLFSSVIVFQGF